MAKYIIDWHWDRTYHIQRSEKFRQNLIAFDNRGYRYWNEKYGSWIRFTFKDRKHAIRLAIFANKLIKGHLLYDDSH
jgi:hypothetical protein